jgi:hypothetical protein
MTTAVIIEHAQKVIEDSTTRDENGKFASNMGLTERKALARLLNEAGRVSDGLYRFSDKSREILESISNVRRYLGQNKNLYRAGLNYGEACHSVLVFEFGNIMTRNQTLSSWDKYDEFVQALTDELGLVGEELSLAEAQS